MSQRISRTAPPVPPISIPGNSYAAPQQQRELFNSTPSSTSSTTPLSTPSVTSLSAPPTPIPSDRSQRDFSLESHSSRSRASTDVTRAKIMAGILSLKGAIDDISGEEQEVCNQVRKLHLLLATGEKITNYTSVYQELIISCVKNRRTANLDLFIRVELFAFLKEILIRSCHNGEDDPQFNRMKKELFEPINDHKKTVRELKKEGRHLLTSTAYIDLKIIEFLLETKKYASGRNRTEERSKAIDIMIKLITLDKSVVGDLLKLGVNKFIGYFQQVYKGEIASTVLAIEAYKNLALNGGLTQGQVQILVGKVDTILSKTLHWVVCTTCIDFFMAVAANFKDAGTQSLIINKFDEILKKKLRKIVSIGNRWRIKAKAIENLFLLESWGSQDAGAVLANFRGGKDIKKSFGDQLESILGAGVTISPTRLEYLYWHQIRDSLSKQEQFNPYLSEFLSTWLIYDKKSQAAYLNDLISYTAHTNSTTPSTSPPAATEVSCEDVEEPENDGGAGRSIYQPEERRVTPNRGAMFEFLQSRMTEMGRTT